ncbi:MAG: ABC transporter ATP-binding protein [Eubacteriales bacterium]|nr:ABC transporter ATP-binding protein [Eubacteriales bacterium]
MELNFQKVSKFYGNKKALNPFSATLTEGVYGLLGPNGAGKSTLMNILTGNLTATSGQILLDGHDIRDMKKNYFGRIGYMPQQEVLYPTFTVEHFLYYMASLHGMSNQAASERIDEMLLALDLEDVRKTPIGQLSGGMKRRLLLAQAMIHEPDILILDEPTTGLDPKQRIAVRNLIAEFARERIVILSTHIVADVDYIATELLFISRGNLLEKGSPTSFLDNLQGHIWEVTVPTDCMSQVTQSGTVTALYKCRDTITVRILSDQAPVYPCKAVPPTLEDVYLNFFKDDEI